VPETRTDLDAWTVALTSIVVTFIVIAVSHALVRRLTRKRATTQAALERTHRPAQVVALVVVVRITVPPLLGSWQQPVASILNVAVVAAVAWLVATVVLRIEEFTLQRFRVDVADNLAARRVHTQVSILRRVTIVVISVLAVGAALVTFPQARTAGASLLASAGVAGVIAGLAAQSTLGNLFAGLNLAFGDALRLDDVVVVEGEWGRVEEITLSYVVVRIWDQRRLILPSSYFTTTPFQNWTRTSADIIGTVELDVDWSVPVDQLREAARRVVEGSDLWDGRAFALHITDATGGLVRARVMVSAADSSKLWDLRCLVRERLVTWLQQEHPSALPRTRTELEGALSRLPEPRRPEPA
jgi:Small-conductance mechanosensitive channel